MQGIRHTDGNEVLLETNTTFLVVQGNIGLLLVYLDEKTHEEAFLAELGPKTFNRPLLTHRIGITTEWKRAGKLSRDNTKARESILEEDLAKSVSLSVYNSFCLNRESNVNKLSNYLKSLQEQRVDTGLQATENRGRNRDQLR